MFIYQVFFIVFAVSIPIATLLVAGRHVWILFQSLRARRYKYLLISILAIMGIAAAFAAVGFVWFAYAVAHSYKPLWRELLLIVVTGLPFYGVAYYLWRLAGKLQGEIRHHIP